jgi:hypothetical protein
MAKSASGMTELGMKAFFEQTLRMKIRPKKERRGGAASLR